MLTCVHVHTHLMRTYIINATAFIDTYSFEKKINSVYAHVAELSFQQHYMHFNEQSVWECFPETHPLLQLLLLGKGPLLHPPVPLSPPHLHLPWEKPPYYISLLQLHNKRGADVENPSSICVLSVTCVASLICIWLKILLKLLSVAYPQIS